MNDFIKDYLASGKRFDSGRILGIGKKPDDRYDHVCGFVTSDGIHWEVYKQMRGLHPEWDNVKFVRSTGQIVRGNLANITLGWNGERFADVSYLPDLQKRYPEMLDKALVVLHEF